MCKTLLPHLLYEVPTFGVVTCHIHIGSAYLSPVFGVIMVNPSTT